MPFEAAGETVRVAVRLSPKSARNRVIGVAEDAAGGKWLKVSVTAPPEDDKANRAMIALLAKEWGIAKSAVRLVGGATSRRKTLAVDGPPAILLPGLREWLRGIDD